MGRNNPAKTINVIRVVPARDLRDYFDRPSDPHLAAPTTRLHSNDLRNEETASIKRFVPASGLWTDGEILEVTCTIRFCPQTHVA